MTTETTNNLDAMKQTADHVERRVESAVDTMQQRIVESIQPAAEQVQSFAERQKSLGAEQLGGVARAVHSAAREFESEMPGVAQSVHNAAAKLEDASSSLREQSPEDIVGAIGRFARNQPAAFFGGAILAGFALSRFLKSSAARHSA